ncbi:peroxiredoxin/predicted 2-oxoglutarate/Fe(II)-dependent dioxygenase YbiX [Pseudomonas laurylsulfativorans]|uniref:redoxin domain-containing protein n=1 Tax=Pseudomonas laurylsulfativorans TaxID=1943631 RepID=UPI00209D93A4|nr:redoxin domain-containing protein [Pseudomonas laurylsulfativorans]MCP1418484.1 peroxiredoxin/predicted 2-oxoglutarate/Fe(II)-dependent dioxygenase YbiX [Pseudomonas laurylsulfativorans]
MRATAFSVGQPAPWFHCRTQLRERFCFDTIAGRYVVLCFFGSAADPAATEILDSIQAHRQRFDDAQVCFFGVSVDPDDETLKRVESSIPGIRFIWDFDRSVSQLYGALQPDGSIRQMTYVLDPALRVLAIVPIETAIENHVPSLVRYLDKLPAPVAPHAATPHAPVLVVPRIFEPSLCKALISYYDERGGEESGFMTEQSGKTVHIKDHSHKKRRDCVIEDEVLAKACSLRITNRLLPELQKAFQFNATRMERYLVSCYNSEEGGYFRPHRDNTTKGTAHRRFAVSLFLNSGEYDGGFLRFPEYGKGLYSAPTGGAVVFSCSLLHEATSVTQGRRYMFLPFLYDEAASAIREENLSFIQR